MKSEVETNYIKLGREEGILCGAFVKNIHIDLEKAKECVQTRVDFSQGISYPCLFDMREVRSITKEAREYLADEGSKFVKAGALLIGSAVTRALGNIFLTINRPPVPTKLFTDEKEAKEWLKQYL